MKKLVLILIIIAAFNSGELHAQQDKYKAQRDSAFVLFHEALLRLDSITAVNNGLVQLAEQQDEQIADLKKRIVDLIKTSEETVLILEKTKKLIAEQIAVIDKLEAEVKRLSQPKGKSQ